MFERFARDARLVVKHAETEARERGSTTIEAEHLLLALTDCDPATPAGQALAAAGLDRAALEQALASERERSLMSVGISIHDFDLPAPHPAARPRMAASAKSALEHALRISLVRADKRIGAGPHPAGAAARRGRHSAARTRRGGRRSPRAQRPHDGGDESLADAGLGARATGRQSTSAAGRVPTTASASISTRQRGSRKPETTMNALAGRTSPNTRPCTSPTATTVGCIDEEDTRAHHVGQRRAGLAQRRLDDLQAALGLAPRVGIHRPVGT